MAHRKPIRRDRKQAPQTKAKGSRRSPRRAGSQSNGQQRLATAAFFGFVTGDLVRPVAAPLITLLDPNKQDPPEWIPNPPPAGCTFGSVEVIGLDDMIISSANAQVRARIYYGAAPANPCPYPGDEETQAGTVVYPPAAGEEPHNYRFIKEPAGADNTVCMAGDDGAGQGDDKNWLIVWARENAQSDFVQIARRRIKCRASDAAGQPPCLAGNVVVFDNFSQGVDGSINGQQTAKPVNGLWEWSHDPVTPIIYKKVTGDRVLQLNVQVAVAQKSASPTLLLRDVEDTGLNLKTWSVAFRTPQTTPRDGKQPYDPADPTNETWIKFVFADFLVEIHETSVNGQRKGEVTDGDSTSDQFDWHDGTWYAATFETTQVNGTWRTVVKVWQADTPGNDGNITIIHTGEPGQLNLSISSCLHRHESGCPNCNGEGCEEECAENIDEHWILGHVGAGDP